MTAAVTVQRKTIIVLTWLWLSLSKQSFSKCLEQIQEILGSSSFLLIFCRHWSGTLCNRRFVFFVEQLVQPSASQFVIFNVKCKCFFHVLFQHILRHGTCIVFYEALFISDKETFFVMKFLNTVMSEKLSQHIFKKRSAS